MKGGGTTDIASYTLESKFKFALGFWEFTDGYSGLTDYNTFEERKEDISLHEYINLSFKDNFDQPLIA